MLPWVRIRSLVKAPIFGALLLLAWGQTLGGAQACPCLDGADNFCQYGPSYPGCTMTYPGGYCDPNGDGDFSDADWARGYYEYLDACGPGDGDPLPDVYIECLDRGRRRCWLFRRWPVCGLGYPWADGGRGDEQRLRHGSALDGDEWFASNYGAGG